MRLTKERTFKNNVLKILWRLKNAYSALAFKYWKTKSKRSINVKKAVNLGLNAEKSKNLLIKVI